MPEVGSAAAAASAARGEAFNADRDRFQQGTSVDRAVRDLGDKATRDARRKEETNILLQKIDDQSAAKEKMTLQGDVIAEDIVATSSEPIPGSANPVQEIDVPKIPGMENPAGKHKAVELTPAQKAKFRKPISERRMPRAPGQVDHDRAMAAREARLKAKRAGERAGERGGEKAMGRLAPSDKKVGITAAEVQAAAEAVERNKIIIASEKAKYLKPGGVLDRLYNQHDRAAIQEMHESVNDLVAELEAMEHLDDNEDRKRLLMEFKALQKQGYGRAA